MERRPCHRHNEVTTSGGSGGGDGGGGGGCGDGGATRTLPPPGRAAEWAIAQPSSINWAAIPRYVIASEDGSLAAAAAAAPPRVAFVSSTSSMTGLLSALYRPVSNWRDTGLVPGGGGWATRL